MKKAPLKYSDNITITEEYFELRLACDCDTIDVQSLIKYLNQANLMVQGINETLNKDYNCGYDDIEVEVYTIEHGSIRIPFKLKKFAEKLLYDLPIAIIGGVAVYLICGNKEPIIIQTNDGEIEAAPETFLENKQTKKSVGKIARMVVEDDGINNLSLTYEKSNGNKESVTISKNQLEKVAEECEDTDDDIITTIPKTRLQIYGPILDSRPSSWRVKFNGNIIPARMADTEFLDEMTAKKIAFAPDDEIIADLEQIISEDEKGQHVKWYIRKVHSYPKYTRIIKGAQQRTLDL